jgi:hypothetical protein
VESEAGLGLVEAIGGERAVAGGGVGREGKRKAEERGGAMLQWRESERERVFMAFIKAKPIGQ